jgi:hypothetical protein
MYSFFLAEVKSNYKNAQDLFSEHNFSESKDIQNKKTGVIEVFSPEFLTITLTVGKIPG